MRSNRPQACICYAASWSFWLSVARDFWKDDKVRRHAFFAIKPSSVFHLLERARSLEVDSWLLSEIGGLILGSHNKGSYYLESIFGAPDFFEPPVATNGIQGIRRCSTWGPLFPGFALSWGPYLSIVSSTLWTCFLASATWTCFLGHAWL